MADEEKKIIIDEDWKNQAQKEKEELKQQEAKKTDESDQGAPHPMPKADFSGMVSMLATQAFYALGLIRPEGQEDSPAEPNFPIAKYNIDTLGMLEEKCKGNLTDEEENMLKETLSQLRMLFVQLSKQG